MSDALKLAPAFLRKDRNGFAILKAIEAADDWMQERIQAATDALFDVEKMPEARLDERAWEMNLTWYDYGADVESKRDQIRGARNYFDRLGTPYAVERAIEDVFGQGRVEEWFENSAEPYHFSVYTSNTGAMMENRKKFLKIMERVKNVRSVLDNIVYYGLEGEAQAYASAAFMAASIRAGATAKIKEG